MVSREHPLERGVHGAGKAVTKQAPWAFPGHLLASLRHAGIRVFLGLTLNTLRHVILIIISSCFE